MQRSILLLALVLLAPTLSAHDLKDASTELAGLYGKIQTSLAADSTDGVLESAAKIAEAAESYANHSADKARYEEIAAAAKKIKGPGIEALREESYDLGKLMAQLVLEFKVEGMGAYYCPMADGYWAQTVGSLRNPYYGSSMLECGRKVEKVGAE